ncbi:MAG: fumarate hydratase, partial [Cloacibacillus sp.]|nr:fumarate hydratase [Cloacibacillus sp.]
MSKIYRIAAEAVTEKVCELALTANMYLPEEVKRALTEARAAEKMPLARSTYDEIIRNEELAAEKY